jgi:hypothetical protein
MELSEIPSDRIILILGAPRSGTSWLAKIFDSHPDVLYRHEPDTVLRSVAFPSMCASDDLALYRDAGEAYLRQLVEVATLKSAGSIPLFRKGHHSPFASLLRSAMIYGLRAADMTGIGRQLVRGIRVPDQVDLARHPEIRVVIKSVGSRGRARLFAEALPGARIIFILRDPFGQVASMLRGTALNKFENTVHVGEFLQAQEAREYGLTPERFRLLPMIERYAWNWAILNEKAIRDLAGIPTARVLYYQDLGLDPLGQAHALFNFVGLDWDPQSEDFIRRSTTHKGRDRYYKVFRNTAETVSRWRTELSLDDQRRISSIARQTSLAPYCPEISESLSEASDFSRNSPVPCCRL